MTKPARKKPATKKLPGKAPPNPSAKNSSVKTDQEKRLARNAALRTWRKANKEKVSAYMKEWREKRGEKAAKTAAKVATAKIAKKGGTA